MPTLPQALDLPPDITKIAEPLLLGHILNWGLFGALSVQVYVYHLAFADDLLAKKVLVYAVYAAELVQSILLAQTAFKEFATGFGRFEALDDDGILWFAVPVLDSSVAFVVQVYYAYRIKMLADSKSYLIPIVVVLFALVQLGGGIALGVTSEQAPTFSQLLSKTPLGAIEISIWNSVSAACDVIIAASMTYYLSRWKSNSKPTQRKIQKLTRLFIETGTVTATVATTNLILYLIPSTRSYFETSGPVLGKLYSNTMVFALNSRIVFATDESASHNLSSLAYNPETSTAASL